MAYIPDFSAKRKELSELVRLFRKGNKKAWNRLRILLADPQYREVFSATYKSTPEERALQRYRSRNEKILYKSDGGPVQGGAPGLGKR